MGHVSTTAKELVSEIERLKHRVAELESASKPATYKLKVAQEYVLRPVTDEEHQRAMDGCKFALVEINHNGERDRVLYFFEKLQQAVKHLERQFPGSRVTTEIGAEQ